MIGLGQASIRSCEEFCTQYLPHGFLIQLLEEEKLDSSHSAGNWI